MPPQLADAPEFPDELRYLWNWHCELGSQDALTYAELLAWASLTDSKPLAWEVDVLMGLDRLFWSVIHG